MDRPRILFVTGKLAEPALRRTLATLSLEVGFEYALAVVPITVVALADTRWIARHLRITGPVERLILPGLCPGELTPLQELAGCPVDRGPKDLRDLPEYFGKPSSPAPDLGRYNIEILAEINSASRLSILELLNQARSYRESGADIIDLGCDPGETWHNVGEAVRTLRSEGFRLSIDTFNSAEAAAAVEAGAELVLSVNRTNLPAARSWGCEVVAVPDVPATLEGLDQTVQTLGEWGVPFRIDPILEPIAFGFAASLGRYLEVRQRYPEAAMLMGVGNLTELSDVDSAGINFLLTGFCQEIGIRSVLTTQVINWCRSAVRELDLARRIVYHACKDRVLPKHVSSELIMLRDSKPREHGAEVLGELAQNIKDRNFRLFAERGQLHAMNAAVNLKSTDPFELFEEIQRLNPVDPGHAFYLGYELAKAVTALTLGKNYTQDQALCWGFLTVPEESHHSTIISKEP